MNHDINRPPGITGHSHDHSHEHKTRLVVIVTAITMVVEIVYGYWTNSMALLADGYHMSTHVFALGLSWIAYIVARRYALSETISMSREKLLALSGFTSALVLQAVAIVMAFEAVMRLVHPREIRFTEAIIVAVVGLVVNLVCAIILHHKREHSDHNIRSAYLHVIADGLTSVTAILALTAGMFFKLYSLDAISGIISSVIITKWAVDLMRNSGKELIEYRKKS